MTKQHTTLAVLAFVLAIRPAHAAHDKPSGPDNQSAATKQNADATDLQEVDSIRWTTQSALAKTSPDKAERLPAPAQSPDLPPPIQSESATLRFVTHEEPTHEQPPIPKDWKFRFIETGRPSVATPKVNSQVVWENDPGNIEHSQRGRMAQKAVDKSPKPRLVLLLGDEIPESGAGATDNSPQQLDEKSSASDDAEKQLKELLQGEQNH